jgi:hypothetical protein
MISVRPAETDSDLEAWAELKSTVVPNEPGSFVAFEDGEPVGFAGLNEHANRDATAEHGLTLP